MTRLLLYGATGYSGRLLARELARPRPDGAPRCELILGGRDEGALRRLARDVGAGYVVFGLSDRRDVNLALRDMDVVLNAAGPFSETAERIAKVALDVGCNYVDIGGEPDVYRRLNDLIPLARNRGRVLAPCAGFWSAASNLLLGRALAQLGRNDLGAVRIAMSRVDTCSRGSVETLWRSMREEVLVARRTMDERGRPEMSLWHEPVGRLERRFDFRDPGEAGARIGVGSAVSLVDTLAALALLRRRKTLADTVESYVEMDDAARILYQMSSWLAPVVAMPFVGTLVRQPAQLLARGPTKAERQRSPHLVVLEIDDRTGQPLARWRWKTPNIYQFTAQLAAEVAVRVGEGRPGPGWATAAEVMDDMDPALAAAPAGDAGPLRGTTLEAA